MKKAIVTLITAIGVATSANATLLDMELPVKPLSIGVRLGMNSSNMSNNFVSADPMYGWTSTGWGTGFTGGVVVDLNLKNCFALQPGFFFQSRNMEYRNEFNTVGVGGQVGSLDHIESGHTRTYNFNIPIMMSLRMNLTPVFQVRAEVGPYFQWALGDGSDKYTVSTVGTSDMHYQRDIYGDDGVMRGFDWGFKMGGGLTFMGRYHLTIHYMAGCRNIYKQPVDVRHDVSGKNKCWDITFGYNIF